MLVVDVLEIVPTTMLGAPVNPAALPVHDPELPEQLPVTLPVKVGAVTPPPVIVSVVPSYVKFEFAFTFVALIPVVMTLFEIT